MKEDNKGVPIPQLTIQILFADDDTDDHFFFKRALKEVPFNTHFISVGDGTELMDYLLENIGNLPDILFLDNNMPRKKGYECLADIKRNPKLKDLPVVIYSTYLDDDIADLLYEKGAYYYIRKTAQAELKKTLQYIFTLIVEGKFERPTRDRFVLSPLRYNF
jgi:CheY-like chemotaxis protein